MVGKRVQAAGDARDRQRFRGVLKWRHGGASRQPCGHVPSRGLWPVLLSKQDGPGRIDYFACCHCLVRPVRMAVGHNAASRRVGWESNPGRDA